MPTLMKHNPPKDKKQEKAKQPDMGYGKSTVRFPGGKLRDSYGGGKNTDLLPYIKAIPGQIKSMVSKAIGKK